MTKVNGLATPHSQLEDGVACCAAFGVATHRLSRPNKASATAVYGVQSRRLYGRTFRNNSTTASDYQAQCDIRLRYFLRLFFVLKQLQHTLCGFDPDLTIAREVARTITTVPNAAHVQAGHLCRPYGSLDSLMLHAAAAGWNQSLDPSGC